MWDYPLRTMLYFNTKPLIILKIVVSKRLNFTDQEQDFKTHPE